MKIRDGAIPIGKGQFVWVLSRCAGGNMARLVQMCLDAGLDWISIKVANGTSVYKGSASELWQQQKLLDELVPRAKAAEIGVHFWGYTYAKRPGRESVPIIEMIRKHRPLSYTINAEKEYKNQAGKQAAIDHASAIRLAMSVSSSYDIPDIPIGLSSYRWPSVHPEFPWVEFARYIDFHNPQVYWQGANNPREQLIRSVNELRNLKDVPIVPAGTMYPHKRWKPTPSQIIEFMATAQELGLPGVNFWEWYYAETKYPELWEAMSDYSWTTQEQPDPEPPTLPPTPQPGTGIIIPSIPYKSQKDPDAIVYVNDCGPAALAGILNAHGLNLTTDEVYRATGAPPDRYVSIGQMKRAAASYDIPFEYFSSSNLYELKQLVKEGKAPIALVHYGAWAQIEPGVSTQSSFTGPHFVVVVGYDDEHIYVNDPLWWGDRRSEGEHKRWTYDEFNAAWGSAHKDDNRDFSGIFCTVPLATEVLGEVVTPPEPQEPPIDGDEIHNQAIEDFYSKITEAKDELKRE